MGPPSWAVRDATAASIYQSENSEGPLGGPPVFIIKRPQLITSIAECILTCLKFHVVRAVLDATESRSMRCGLQKLSACGGPAVWGSGKGALWADRLGASPQGRRWSWDTGIMEGGGSLHILLCESQPSLHMASMLSVLVEEGRQLGTLPEPQLQYRNCSLRP